PRWGAAAPPPPPPAASAPRVLTTAPTATNRIALTVDDGYRDEVVAGYVNFAVRTGIHLTFCPNGLYSHAWAPHDSQLKPLIERGQVQIVNHTFSHPDLRTLTDQQIRVDRERNGEGGQKVCGTGPGPSPRPPYGLPNEPVGGPAAALGTRNGVLWTAPRGDGKQAPPEAPPAPARRYLQPGA